MSNKIWNYESRGDEDTKGEQKKLDFIHNFTYKWMQCVQEIFGKISMIKKRGGKVMCERRG